MTDDRQKALNAVCAKWIDYINNMRPETRNDFLREWDANFHLLGNDALSPPPVDVGALKEKLWEKYRAGYDPASAFESQAIDWTIDYLHQRNLLQGQQAEWRGAVKHLLDWSDASGLQVIPADIESRLRSLLT